jgi:hypothetical protein
MPQLPAEHCPTPHFFTHWYCCIDACRCCYHQQQRHPGRFDPTRRSILPFLPCSVSSSLWLWLNHCYLCGVMTTPQNSGLSSVVTVWLVALAWRLHGNLIELSFTMLSLPDELSPLWWIYPLFPLMIWLIPLTLLSIAGHTIRLIHLEIQPSNF